MNFIAQQCASAMLLLGIWWAPSSRLPVLAEEATPLPFPPHLIESARDVSADEMQQVYDQVKTPHKYGVVLQPEENQKFDCPNVFRHGDKWYMVYAVFEELVGYETCLAESDDLLHWQPLGTILPFSKTGWDAWQADGGVALIDHQWGGSAELQTYKDKYWMTYIGGAKQGYEPDPLKMGLAWSKTPHQPIPWTRYEGNPILSPADPDTRFFEKKTIYKSNVIWDKEESLGYPFVMFYNGKEEAGGGHEMIGLAVSRNMKDWRRLGDTHVIYNDPESRYSISGDPQVVRIDDLWVMFYFGAFWQPGAFDTFACSYDLINWTKWEGPHLVEPSEPYDETFAHKPWLIKHDGIVYHFYCAVGDQKRNIALATSKDLSSKREGFRAEEVK